MSRTSNQDESIIDWVVSGDAGALEDLKQVGMGVEQIRARAGELGLTNEFVKRCRLAESRAAMRTCIRCDVSFLSSGNHNRMCTRCHAR